MYKWLYICQGNSRKIYIKLNSLLWRVKTEEVGDFCFLHYTKQYKKQRPRERYRPYGS